MLKIKLLNKTKLSMNNNINHMIIIKKKIQLTGEKLHKSKIKASVLVAGLLEL